MLFHARGALRLCAIGLASACCVGHCLAAAPTERPALEASVCSTHLAFVQNDLRAHSGVAPILFNTATSKSLRNEAREAIESASLLPLKDAVRAMERVVAATAVFAAAASVPEGSSVDGLAARRQALGLAQQSRGFIAARHEGTEAIATEQALRAAASVLPLEHRARLSPEILLGLRLWLEAGATGTLWQWGGDADAAERLGLALVDLALGVPEGVWSRWMSPRGSPMDRAARLQDEIVALCGAPGGGGLRIDAAEAPVGVRYPPQDAVHAEIRWILDALSGSPADEMTGADAYRVCRIATWLNEDFKSSGRGLRARASDKPAAQFQWLTELQARWHDRLVAGSTPPSAGTEWGTLAAAAVDQVFPACVLDEGQQLRPSNDILLVQLAMTYTELVSLLPYMAGLVPEESNVSLTDLKQIAVAAWVTKRRVERLYSVVSTFETALTPYLDDALRQSVSAFRARVDSLSCRVDEDPTCVALLSEEGKIPKTLSEADVRRYLKQQLAWPSTETITQVHADAVKLAESLRQGLERALLAQAKVIMQEAADAALHDGAAAVGGAYGILDPTAFDVLWTRGDFCLVIQRQAESGADAEHGPFALDLLIGARPPRISERAAWSCSQQTLWFPLGVRLRNALHDPETGTYTFAKPVTDRYRPVRDDFEETRRSTIERLGVPSWLIRGPIEVVFPSETVLERGAAIEVRVPVGLPVPLGKQPAPPAIVTISLPDGAFDLDAAAMEGAVRARVIAKVEEALPKGEVQILGDIVTVSGLKHVPDPGRPENLFPVHGIGKIQIRGQDPIAAPIVLGVRQTGDGYRPVLALGAMEDAAKERLLEQIVSSAADLQKAFAGIEQQVQTLRGKADEVIGDVKAMGDRAKSELQLLGVTVADDGMCPYPAPDGRVAVCFTAAMPYPVWLAGSGAGKLAPIVLDATLSSGGSFHARTQGDVAKILENLALERLRSEAAAMAGQACKSLRASLHKKLSSLDPKVVLESQDEHTRKTDTEAGGAPSDGLVRLYMPKRHIDSLGGSPAILDVDLSCSERLTLDFSDAKLGGVDGSGKAHVVSRDKYAEVVADMLGINLKALGDIGLLVDVPEQLKHGLVFRLQLNDVPFLGRVPLGVATLNADAFEARGPNREALKAALNEKLLELLEPHVSALFSGVGIGKARPYGDLLDSDAPAGFDFDVPFEAVGTTFTLPIRAQIKPTWDVRPSGETWKQAIAGVVNTMLGPLMKALGAPALDPKFVSEPRPHIEVTIDSGLVALDGFEFNVTAAIYPKEVKVQFPLSLEYKKPIHVEPLCFADATLSVDDEKFNSVTLSARGTLIDCNTEAAFYMLGVVRLQFKEKALGLTNTAYLMGFPVFNNEGRLSEKEAVSTSESVGPMKAIIDLRHTTRIAKDNGFSFDGKLEIFGLDIADAQGTINRSGTVLANAAVNGWLGDNEAAFLLESYDFPKDLSVGVKVSVLTVGSFNVGGFEMNIGVRRAKAKFTVLGVGFVLVEGSWRHIREDAILDAILAMFKFDPKAILEMLKNFDKAKLPKEFRLKAPDGWSTSSSSGSSESGTGADGSSAGGTELGDGGGLPGQAAGGRIDPPPGKKGSPDESDSDPVADPTMPAGNTSAALVMSAYSAGGCRVSDVNVQKGCFARIGYEGTRVCQQDVFGNHSRTELQSKRPVLTIGEADVSRTGLWPGEPARHAVALATTPSITVNYVVTNAERSLPSEVIVVAPKGSENLTAVAHSPLAACSEEQGGSAPASSLGITLDELQPGVNVDSLGSGVGPRLSDGARELLTRKAILAVQGVSSTHRAAPLAGAKAADGSSQSIYVLQHALPREDEAPRTWLGFSDGVVGEIASDGLLAEALGKLDAAPAPAWLRAYAATANSLRRAWGDPSTGRAVVAAASSVHVCSDLATACRSFPALWGLLPPADVELRVMEPGSFEEAVFDRVNAASAQSTVLFHVSDTEALALVVPEDGAADLTAAVRVAVAGNVARTSLSRACLAAHFDTNPACEGASTATLSGLAALVVRPAEARGTCPALTDVMYAAESLTCDRN